MSPRFEKSNEKRSGSVQVGRGRDTSLARRQPTLTQRKSVLIVTNGKRTEIQYFDALRTQDWMKARLVSVFKDGSPAVVVDHARSVTKQSEYDETWAVFDIDEFDIREACDAAKACNVEVAVSNPSFEVWLILHLCDWTAHFENAERVLVQLKKILSSYDKSKLRFSDFSSGIFDAVKRAERLGEPPAANPSTGVGRIIGSLTAE